MSVFSSFIHASHEKSSAADVFAFPSQAKKRNHWRGRSALKSPELLTTNGCKRLQGLRLQHTNDCMHADGPGPGPGRKEKGKRGCGIFAIRWRAWQECSSPMHPSDHRMVGQEWRKWYQYSSETAKSVSDCVTGRANGTERRRDAERPKSQSKH